MLTSKLPPPQKKENAKKNKNKTKTKQNKNNQANLKNNFFYFYSTLAPIQIYREGKNILEFLSCNLNKLDPQTRSIFFLSFRKNNKKKQNKKKQTKKQKQKQKKKLFYILFGGLFTQFHSMLRWLPISGKGSVGKDKLPDW